MEDFLFKVSIWAIPAILAITLHEAAHGYVALRFGDDTALREGRVTLNPFRHIDAFGTLILPGLLLLLRAPFLFGWAKPVPVNFWRLHNPRRDMVWVAAAGPVMNLALATLSALAVHLLGFLPDGVGNWVGHNLVNSIQINLLLAVFNMIPIPPLDGGRVAVGLLPDVLAAPLARAERFGMLLLLMLLFVLPVVGNEVGVNLNILPWLLLGPVNWLLDVVISLTGIA